MSATNTLLAAVTTNVLTLFLRISALLGAHAVAAIDDLVASGGIGVTTGLLHLVFNVIVDFGPAFPTLGLVALRSGLFSRGFWSKFGIARLSHCMLLRLAKDRTKRATHGAATYVGALDFRRDTKAVDPKYRP